MVHSIVTSSRSEWGKLGYGYGVSMASVRDSVPVLHGKTTSVFTLRKIISEAFLVDTVVEVGI